MATNKRFFTPRILNRLDNWLLINKPETWSARTHLVIYYGALFMAVLAAICFVYPDDARSATGVGNWALFTSVIAILALVLWIIYLLRFNVFKRFGNTTPINRLTTFLLYFAAAGTITLITYVEPLVETIKANMAYGNEEVVRDINNINVKLTQVEHDSLDNAWGRDTFRIVNKIVSANAAADENDTTATITSDYDVTVARHLRLMDTADLHRKLLSVDSTQKLNDSVYIFLTCPDYTWIQESSADNYTHTQQMTDRDIYDSVIVNFRKPSPQVKTELKALINKYYYDHEDRYYEYTDTRMKNYRDSIVYKYSINDVGRSFTNITERKYRWCGLSGQILFRIFFYISLALTLLVFVFRHSTVRTFFFTLLAAIIITILSALLIAFARWYNEASSLFGLMLFYFVLFTGVSLTAFTNTTRSIISGIAANLFVFMVAFVPLMIAGMHNLYEDEKYRGIPVPHPAPVYWNLVYAEVAGVVILLVLLPTYIHRLYRRWYALPEN
jgi:hypothetical protein